MQNLTNDQKKDVQTRIDLFQKDFEEIQKKHEIEVSAYPQYIPTQFGFTTVAQVGLRDTKYAPVPSPLNGSIIKEK